MTEKVIETMMLTKNYGDFTAVNKLNMDVMEGEIFGFLGPNGAGKTTTILMLMGLSVPSSGTAVVGGYDIIEQSREVRQVASILPEYSSLYGELTAFQNLNYIGELNDIDKSTREDKIEELLKIVDMTDWRDAKLESFSRGMKQRIGIASALIKEPKVLFLDEPTIGLDPVGTREIRELIIQLNRKQGLTVVMTSHLLNEVQMTCSRVGIINSGNLVMTDTLANLSNDVNGLGERRVEFKLSEIPKNLAKNLEGIDGVKSVTVEADRLFVSGTPESDYHVSKSIVDHGAVILIMRSKEYSLEEIFMKYYEEEN